MWRKEDTRLEGLLDDGDDPVRLLTVQLDDHAVGVIILVPGDQRPALAAFTHGPRP
jgi:hypothetical protein